MKKLLLALLLLLPLSSFAKEPSRIIDGVVLKVADGDTLTVDADGTKVKVRVYGIHSPEAPRLNPKTGAVSKPGQPYGEESATALRLKTLGRVVRLGLMAVDKCKKAVCVV